MPPTLLSIVIDEIRRLHSLATSRFSPGAQAQPSYAGQASGRSDPGPPQKFGTRVTAIMKEAGGQFSGQQKQFAEEVGDRARRESRLESYHDYCQSTTDQCGNNDPLPMNPSNHACILCEHPTVVNRR